MTMEIAGEHEVEEKVEPKEPYYSIYPEAIEGRGQKLGIVIGERLCEAAKAKAKTPDAWLTMTYKELRKLAKDNCTGQEGYLSPQQPVLETVFRVLLSAREDRLSLTAIHDELADLWMTSSWPRHITREALQRVLDNALKFGIVAVDE